MNSTLTVAVDIAGQESWDLFKFQQFLLFVSRVAFQLLVTQITFCHPWAEVVVVCIAGLTVASSKIWGFGTALVGFMLIKTLTIFTGRIMFIGVRVTNHYFPIPRNRQDWIGTVMSGFLLLNILEAGLSQAKLGYFGGLFGGIALAVPWTTLPRARSFCIRKFNYFYGTSWPWIVAYTTWNLAFTILQERGEKNMTFDTILANAAGLTADFINAARINPGAWIHSRAQTLMWTLVFGVMNENRPMMSNPAVDQQVSTTNAHIVDVVSTVIVLAFCALHCWGLFRPAPLQKKTWVFKKLQGSVFQGFIPCGDEISEHLLHAALNPMCGPATEYVEEGKMVGSAVNVDPSENRVVSPEVKGFTSEDSSNVPPHNVVIATVASVAKPASTVGPL